MKHCNLPQFDHQENMYQSGVFLALGGKENCFPFCTDESEEREG